MTSTRPISAGLLVFRRRAGLEVFLVHPGGPFWAGRDEHAWSIPKGEVDPGDPSPLEAARREFTEETGLSAPAGPFLYLGTVRQSRKDVVAWAVEAELDPEAIVSNTATITWPPRSDRTMEIPEIDRAEWFDLREAERRLHKGQVPLVSRLLTAVSQS